MMEYKKKYASIHKVDSLSGGALQKEMSIPKQVVTEKKSDS